MLGNLLGNKLEIKGLTIFDGVLDLMEHIIDTGVGVRFTKRGGNSGEQVGNRQSHTLKSAHIVTNAATVLVETVRGCDIQAKGTPEGADEELVLQAFIVDGEGIKDSVAQAARTVPFSSEVARE